MKHVAGGGRGRDVRPSDVRIERRWDGGGGGGGYRDDRRGGDWRDERGAPPPRQNRQVSAAPRSMNGTCEKVVKFWIGEARKIKILLMNTLEKHWCLQQEDSHSMARSLGLGDEYMARVDEQKRKRDEYQSRKGRGGGGGGGRYGMPIIILP